MERETAEIERIEMEMKRRRMEMKEIIKKEMHMEDMMDLEVYQEILIKELHREQLN